MLQKWMVNNGYKGPNGYALIHWLIVGNLISVNVPAAVNLKSYLVGVVEGQVHPVKAQDLCQRDERDWMPDSEVKSQNWGTENTEMSFFDTIFVFILFLNKNQFSSGFRPPAPASKCGAYLVCNKIGSCGLKEHCFL